MKKMIVAVTLISIIQSEMLFFPKNAECSDVLPKKINLSFTQKPDTVVYGLLNKIYTEAFGRLGIELHLFYYPAARASAMSDKGVTDGEAWRVYTYGDAHRELIRVPTPNILSKFVAYKRENSDIAELNGWESLKGMKIRVDSRRGQIKTMNKLQENGFIEGKNWETVNSAESGLLKLVNGRTDLYIEVDWVAEQAMKKEHDIKGAKKAGVMEELFSYLYLNKKHSALIPKIDSILKSMHDEGLIEKWVAEAKQGD